MRISDWSSDVFSSDLTDRQHLMSDQLSGFGDDRDSIVPRAASEERPICVRVDRAMQMLDIGKTKLYELIAQGDLEAIRIGRRTLVIDRKSTRLNSSH